MLSFKEFKQTDTYKYADVIEAYDMEGKEVDLDWMEKYSNCIVLNYHTDNKLLMIELTLANRR